MVKSLYPQTLISSVPDVDLSSCFLSLVQNVGSALYQSAAISFSYIFPKSCFRVVELFWCGRSRVREGFWRLLCSNIFLCWNSSWTVDKIQPINCTRNFLCFYLRTNIDTNTYQTRPPELHSMISYELLAFSPTLFQKMIRIYSYSKPLQSKNGVNTVLGPLMAPANQSKNFNTKNLSLSSRTREVEFNF